MRQLLIDYARRQARSRRAHDVLIQLEGASTSEPIVDLLELEEVLAKLGMIDHRGTKIVELRFFGGLSNAEVAQVLNVSLSTVEKDWRRIRAWMHGQLKREDEA